MTDSSQKTIFVSMAAMDDEELYHTIRNAFENAKNPENIFFGIHLTCKSSKTKKDLQKVSKKYQRVQYSVDHQKKNDIKTLGVGRGRSKAHAFYNNQDYLLQIDCHSYLDKFWDSRLIEIFEEAVKEVGDDLLVVTAIPRAYGYEKDGSIKKQGSKTRCSYFKTESFFSKVVPQWGEFDSSDTFEERFLPSVKVNSACVFGNKKFANNPGINPEAIFYDEEITQTYNLFGRGLALVFPNFEDFPVSHLDGEYMTKGHERPFFLDYLDRDSTEAIHDKLVFNYLKFANDPNNQEAINLYRKYSKVDAKKGYFLQQQFFIPKSYRVQP